MVDFLKSKVFSVSESISIANELLQEIKLSVLGEVSELTDSRGYRAVYFSLKDERSVLPCLMWRNIYDYQDIELKEGMLVELSGKFSLYAPKGRFNFSATSIKLAGEGVLREKVERLKRKLASEGLFDDENKSHLPDLPERIGLITSESGAVVHDVLRTLRRHNACIEVVFYGTSVEGSSAALSITEALRALDNEDLDAILLVRGGGSYEDLMVFNDENLVRAIYDMKTPVISGVGHEPDVTLVDCVADVRASTPTAAAEMIVQAREDFADRFRALEASLHLCMEQSILTFSLELKNLEAKVTRACPSTRLDNYLIQLDFASRRMIRVADQIIESKRASLASCELRLDDLSPLSIIKRGYAYLRDERGSVLRGGAVDVGSRIEVVTSSEILKCDVVEKKEEKICG